MLVGMAIDAEMTIDAQIDQGRRGTKKNGRPWAARSLSIDVRCDVRRRDGGLEPALFEVHHFFNCCHRKV